MERFRMEEKTAVAEAIKLTGNATTIGAKINVYVARG